MVNGKILLIGLLYEMFLCYKAYLSWFKTDFRRLKNKVEPGIFFLQKMLDKSVLSVSHFKTVWLAGLYYRLSTKEHRHS